MLLCLTVNHRTAPFELLERLSVPTTAEPAGPAAGSAIGTRLAARDGVRGAVVLATCNRFEAYLDVDATAEAGAAATLDAIETATGVSAAEMAGGYELKAADAVPEHLFSVAAGLESVVVGEGEIAGQVRRALEDGRARGTTTPELERLFQRATEAQKGVKNGTAIGRAGRSLVRLALELADSRIADWATQRVLLVGTGAYAAATVAALRDQGAEDIAVHSPSGRAERFAAKHGLGRVSAQGYREAALTADLIVTCTAHEHPVVDAELLAGFEGSALVIDLGLPRNVHQDVAAIDGITLLDLETIRLHAPLEELQATDDARRMVRDAAERFHTAGRQRSVTPAVVALRQHIFSLTEAEIARAKARGDEQTEQALRHLVGVLLHTPTARAHELAAQGRAGEVFAAVETLFGLDAEPSRGRAGCPFDATA